MSVVVTYRGSGIINLAIGGFAMVAAYAFWALKTGFFNFTLSTIPAFIVAIAAAVGVGVIARAARLPTAAHVVAARQARRLTRASC